MDQTPVPADVLFIFETYRRIRNEVIAEIGDERDKRELTLGGGTLQIEGPNPYYGKTVNGYVLEYYYGSPQKVGTPEGEWTYFSRNCSGLPARISREVDTRLAVALGLTLGKAQRYTTGPCGGEVGPYYKVNGTETFVVPPVESRMLDGKELDGNAKMNLLVGHLEFLLSSR